MPAQRHTGILRSIRRFRRDHRGVSAVEFALLLPVMLTLYLGGSELTQGITLKRKATMVARSVGDLVAQDVSVSNAEMSSVFSAATAIIAPYPAENLKVIVSSIGIDDEGNAKILWSDASGGATPHATNSPVTLPNGLNAFPDTTLIWAEAAYAYTPPIGYAITGTMTLEDEVYLRPRLVKEICREDVSC